MAPDVGLRRFIEVLEKAGELRRISAEVDWQFEIGAILHEVNRRRGPAILFDHVKGYRQPLLAGALGSVGRIALALGLPKTTSSAELITEYKERVKHPIHPEIVATGPCKENIKYDDDVDLYSFPVPLWHELDGGRYIGTLGAVTCKDPDAEWQNVGIHRLVIHDRHTCGIVLAPGQHNAIISAKYEKRGKPTPVAIAIGLDPACVLAAAGSFPAYVNEWSMASALMRAPLPVVKCETADLHVPADAEIVLEGEITLGEVRDEGPFGEHTGYLGGLRIPRPVINVRCVTHREEPILQGAYEGMPPNEDHMLSFINLSAIALKAFEDAGFIGVKSVNFPPGADPWLSAIISLEKKYEGHGIDASRLLLSSKFASFIKHVVIVDDDIDIFDLEKVLWAVNTRFQARRAIITRSERGSSLDPSLPEGWGGITDKMVIDATWPLTPEFPARPEWRGSRHPPTLTPSEALLDHVRRRWQEYGLQGLEEGT